MTGVRRPICHQVVLILLDHLEMEHEFTSDLQIDHLDGRGRHLRIAVVTETYPPEVNGVALTLARLVNGLLERHHSVQLVRLRQPVDRLSGPKTDDAADSHTGAIGTAEAPVLMRGIPIPRYPGLRMGLPCKGGLVKLWSVRRPDLVHIATEGPLGWSALRAAQQLKLPVSSDFRTNFHAYSRHYGAGIFVRSIMLMLRKFHNRTDLTFVPTRTLKMELERSGFKRLMVVGRGVDGDLFNPGRRRAELRRSWGAGEDTLVVLCLGRLAAEKNLDLAVEAFQSISASRPDARLVFVGDGPLRQTLQMRCAQAAFTGMLNGVELAQAVASSDLFLFPSETETFGNVVTEAMASGVATVAYHLAAAAELVREGQNGRTVTPGSRKAFIEVATELALADDARQAMGAQAARDVQALDWPRVVGEFERALLQLVQTQQGLDAALLNRPSWVGRS